MAMKKMKSAKSAKMAKGGVTNEALGSMGRNEARAANQGGKMRGGGAATKGLKISSKMG